MPKQTARLSGPALTRSPGRTRHQRLSRASDTHQPTRHDFAFSIDDDDEDDTETTKTAAIPAEPAPPRTVAGNTHPRGRSVGVDACRQEDEYHPDHATAMTPPVKPPKKRRKRRIRVIPACLRPRKTKPKRQANPEPRKRQQEQKFEEQAGRSNSRGAAAEYAHASIPKSKREIPAAVQASIMTKGTTGTTHLTTTPAAQTPLSPSESSSSNSNKGTTKPAPAEYAYEQESPSSTSSQAKLSPNRQSLLIATSVLELPIFSPPKPTSKTPITSKTPHAFGPRFCKNTSTKKRPAFTNQNIPPNKAKTVTPRLDDVDSHVPSYDCDNGTMDDSAAVPETPNNVGDDVVVEKQPISVPSPPLHDAPVPSDSDDGSQKVMVDGVTTLGSDINKPARSPFPRMLVSPNTDALTSPTTYNVNITNETTAVTVPHPTIRPNTDAPTSPTTNNVSITNETTAFMVRRPTSSAGKDVVDQKTPSPPLHRNRAPSRQRTLRKLPMHRQEQLELQTQVPALVERCNGDSWPHPTAGVNQSAEVAIDSEQCPPPGSVDPTTEFVKKSQTPTTFEAVATDHTEQSSQESPTACHMKAHGNYVLHHGRSFPEIGIVRKAVYEARNSQGEIVESARPNILETAATMEGGHGPAHPQVPGGDTPVKEQQNLANNVAQTRESSADADDAEVVSQSTFKVVGGDFERSQAAIADHEMNAKIFAAQKRQRGSTEELEWRVHDETSESKRKDEFMVNPDDDSNVSIPQQEAPAEEAVNSNDWTKEQKKPDQMDSDHLNLPTAEVGAEMLKSRAKGEVAESDSLVEELRADWTVESEMATNQTAKRATAEKKQTYVKHANRKRQSTLLQRRRRQQAAANDKNDAGVSDSDSASKSAISEQKDATAASGKKRGRPKKQPKLSPRSGVLEQVPGTSGSAKPGRASELQASDDSAVEGDDSQNGRKRKRRKTEAANCRETIKSDARAASNATAAMRTSPTLCMGKSRTEHSREVEPNQADSHPGRKPRKDTGIPRGPRKKGADSRKTSRHGAELDEKLIEGNAVLPQPLKRQEPAVQLQRTPKDDATGETLSTKVVLAGKKKHVTISSGANMVNSTKHREAAITGRRRAPAKNKGKTRGSYLGSRCGECLGCRAIQNCGKCVPCLDLPEFGGPGNLRRICVLRKCIRKGQPGGEPTGEPTSEQLRVDPTADKATGAAKQPPLRGTNVDVQHKSTTVGSMSPDEDEKANDDVESLPDDRSLADDGSDMEWDVKVPNPSIYLKAAVKAVIRSCSDKSQDLLAKDFAAEPPTFPKSKETILATLPNTEAATAPGSFRVEESAVDGNTHGEMPLPMDSPVMGMTAAERARKAQQRQREELFAHADSEEEIYATEDEDFDVHLALPSSPVRALMLPSFNFSS